MTKSEASHVRRLHKQGKQLASANKKCEGKPNDKGQFYKCVANESKKIFKP